MDHKDIMCKNPKDKVNQLGPYCIVAHGQYE